MDVFNITSDSLFVVSRSQNAQKEQYAMRFLDAGLQAYTKKDYTSAIENFQRAIGLAPQSDSALNAYEYIAKSQISQGKPEEAINAYKAMLKIEPRMDSTHVSLGNLYYANDRFEEARASYEKAVQLNPSAPNRYSLGQGYMATGNYSAAVNQFSQIKQETPTEPQGSLGLGQAYAKMGQYDKAIGEFKNAISIRKDYWDAYAEMGYALADSGDFEAAETVATQLKSDSPELAAIVSSYIYDKANPKMVASLSSSTFPTFLTALRAGTKLTTMDLDFATAGAEKTYSVQFMFSKEMARDSVENIYNWSITRAQNDRIGGGYNYGLPTPSTEVNLADRPTRVFYDSTTQTATVLFKVQQNDSANGTIDPAKINFTFKGTDTFGLGMDSKADTYSGYSGFA
jgi:Flp pilus assembly protein TadD